MNENNDYNDLNDIFPSDAKRVQQNLAHLLADSYFLFLKTQNFHWNVEGPQFVALHSLFEKQYQEIYEAIDDIAERLRALGARALGSFEEFSRYATVVESSHQISAEDMVQELLLDHEILLETLNNAFNAATEADDQGTCDLCAARLRAHEKHIWMLRSIIA